MKKKSGENRQRGKGPSQGLEQTVLGERNEKRKKESRKGDQTKAMQRPLHLVRGGGKKPKKSFRRKREREPWSGEKNEFPIIDPSPKKRRAKTIDPELSRRRRALKPERY